MHALRRALRAGILLVGLVCAPFAEAVDGPARIEAELVRLQQDSVTIAEARSQFPALQGQVAADAPYPLQRELAKLRIRLAADDADRERLRDALIALANRNHDSDTANVVRVWRIFDSHVDDNIEVSLRALDALRLDIDEPLPELREALDLSYGYMYWDVGNFEQALRHMLQARQQALRLPDGESRWRKRTESIAQIHTDMGDAAQALLELDRLKDREGDAPDPHALATRATALRLQGRLPEAEALLWPLLEGRPENDAANIAQRVRAELAAVLLQRGQVQRALALSRQMIEASRQGSAYYRAVGQVLEGRALAKLGRVDEGLASMRSGIEYFRGATHWVILLKALGDHAEVLRAAGRDREAIAAMSDRHAIVMRLYNSNRGLGIASLEVDEKLDERERQIRELSSRSELQAAQLRVGRSRSLALLAGVLLSLALIALLSMSLRNVRRQREALWRDALTGTYNRQYFHQRWQAHSLEAGRWRSLMLIDLDHFKQVNDQHGHAAGDAVLRATGQRLRELPGIDAVFRWGGEEFLLVRNAENGHALPEFLAQLQQAIVAPVQVATGTLEASASVGCFSAGAEWWPQAGFDRSLRWADVALYRAKADRRANALAVALTPAGRQAIGIAAPRDAAQLQEWIRKGWVEAQNIRLHPRPPGMPQASGARQRNAACADSAPGQST